MPTIPGGMSGMTPPPGATTRVGGAGSGRSANLVRPLYSVFSDSAAGLRTLLAEEDAKPPPDGWDC